MDVIHHHKPGPISIGNQPKVGVDGEAGDLGGGLRVDPGGKAYKVWLEACWFLYLTSANLGVTYGALRGRGVGGETGWSQFTSGLLEHRLDSLYGLGANYWGGCAMGDLISRLQGRREVHQSLDLNTIPRSHVCYVVEVGWGADHFRSPVRVRFNLLAGLPDGKSSPSAMDWAAITPQHHHAGLNHTQGIFFMNIAEVGDVRHFLEK